MKHLAQEKLAVDVCSAEFAEQLIAYLKTLPELYWYHRKKINSIPTKGTTDANYYFLGDGQMPVELKECLRTLAPTIDGFKPVEMIINRYGVGYGMPEHIDKAFYSYNMVIALSNNGDGLNIEGVFHKDDPGKGVIFPLKSPPHEVPPVQHERFTLIYLYD